MSTEGPYQRKPAEKAEEEEKKGPPPPSGGPTFECKICLEEACEPVVTRCGHLYCWACIYEVHVVS